MSTRGKTEKAEKEIYAHNGNGVIIKFMENAYDEALLKDSKLLAENKHVSIPFLHKHSDAPSSVYKYMYVYVYKRIYMCVCVCVCTRIQVQKLGSKISTYI